VRYWLQFDRDGEQVEGALKVFIQLPKPFQSEYSASPPNLLKALLVVEDRQASLNSLVLGGVWREVLTSRLDANTFGRRWRQLFG
jgi:hypothetical protein